MTQPNQQLTKLLWVIPLKLVDLFWGNGWEHHARYRIVLTQDKKLQYFFLFGHRVPQAVKSNFFSQVDTLYATRTN